MMRKLLFPLILTLLILPIQNQACTSAIVSGKFTKSGRPLIFKHRDTDNLENKLMYFTDGKYEYMGVVNSKDAEGKQVWMGTNSAGFCIMNTASYNLRNGDTTKAQDREGIIMKLALQQCKTLEDFENLLTNMKKPLGVEANFGVIDAYGGAAYYETDNWKFTKIDVNDPNNAPFGYVIRTNYSFRGNRDGGYGYIRYLTTEELIYNAEASQSIDYKFFLKDVSRSLKHSLLNIDWGKKYVEVNQDPYYIITADYIPRHSSASTFLCEGVRKGESVELTTMWVILGYQFSTVAIPTWLAAGKDLPKISIAPEDKDSPICKASLKLKEQIYPIKRGGGNSYLNLMAILNNKGTGVYQKVRSIEDEVFLMADKAIESWREKGFNKNEAKEIYNKIDKLLKEKYKSELDIEINL